MYREYLRKAAKSHIAHHKHAMPASSHAPINTDGALRTTFKVEDYMRSKYISEMMLYKNRKVVRASKTAMEKMIQKDLNLY